MSGLEQVHLITNSKYFGRRKRINSVEIKQAGIKRKVSES